MRAEKTAVREWPEGRNECIMVNVAILGFGTVGSGVAEVLTTNGGLIDHRVDDLVRLKQLCCWFE